MTCSIGIINRIERYRERIFSVPQLVTFPIGNCIKENSKLIMFKTKALAQQPTESTSLLKEGAQGGYSSNKKIAIIGGGVAGISAARIFKQQGLNFDVFEASDSLSGVWSKGYPNFAIQVPGKLYEFPDKELSDPKDYKDGLMIKKYCEEYVTDNGLENSIKLGHRVISIDKTHDEKWKLTVQSARGTSIGYFDFVVVATGIYSPDLKYVPDIQGMKYFKGNVYHSEDTANIEGRDGKKAVVVGFGKSAQDCAMNAYTETKVAPTLLFRNSHWCVPRKVLGLVPFEWLLYSRFGQGTLPRWQTCGPVELVFHTLLRPLIWLYWRIVETILILQLGLYGSSKHLRPSLAIEHDMYCGHGVICHPDFFPLVHKKKINAIHESINQVLPTGELQLTDGSIIDADELVFATGFKREFHFLPNELLEKKEEDGFYTYRNMIVPDVDNIAFLNSNVTTFSNITTPTLQAAWLAELILGNISLPQNMNEQVEEEKLWRREHLRYAGDARAYLIQLHQLRYWDSLLEDIGADIKRKKSGLGPVVDAFMNFFVPSYSSDYKSIATGEWKESKSGRSSRDENKPASFLMEWAILVASIGVLNLFLC